MKIRSSAAAWRSSPGWGVALAGCSKINEVRAMKAFKDGNKLYAQQRLARGRGEVRGGHSRSTRTTLTCGRARAAYFYLANSYDNMYRPTRKGEPTNDAYLEKAIANYKLASEKITNDPKMQGRCRCSTWSPPTARKS